MTDASGNYSFTGLTAGVYRIREVNQAGWTQTTVNPADVTVVSGTNSTGNNFGNTVCEDHRHRSGQAKHGDSLVKVVDKKTGEIENAVLRLRAQLQGRRAACDGRHGWRRRR